MRLRAAAGIAAAAALAASTVPGVASAGPRAPQVAAHPAAAAAAKVHWLSGAWPADTGSLAAIQSFARYRGSKLDVVSVIVPRTSWSDLAAATWVVDDYAGFKGRISIALPLNVNTPGSTLAQVANGKYDTYYKALLQHIVAAGRANSFIRLGWEFNGDWYPWAAHSPSTFKAAFRHVSTLIHKVSPKLRVEWNGNYGYSQVKHNPFSALYPGDAYVNIIGVDAYDRKWFKVTDEQGWQNYLQLQGGLDQWFTFAMKHHKKFSIPEWALFSDGGRDNAFYIQKMHGYFQQHAAQLAYESYFNASGSDQRSSLYAPVQNPKASKTYAKLWKALS
ncbi:MAG TPA: glycosyl hydrolase [Mycobacteriales bacterium]|nr:glycosyl hydrolase [Mycobacteriales bacterium]